MHEQSEPVLLEHDADGIREFDNDLPRWWVWLFYITIVFAAIYLLYFHVLGMGAGSRAKFENEMARVAREAQRQAALTPAAGPVDIQPSGEAEVLAAGREIFTTHCVSCHREGGQGLVGPNLTDIYWIHGPLFADSVRTITTGVPLKGMIAWKAVLRPGEIFAVASYIYTLRGTNPPEPKSPEGTKHEPEPLPPPEEDVSKAGGDSQA